MSENDDTEQNDLELGEDDAVSEAEAEAIAGAVSRRIAHELAEGALDEATVAARIREVLLGEGGGLALLAAAYDEGRAGALIEAARAVVSDDASPSWDDVDGLGMRKVIRSEEHACGTCTHARVCAVSRAADPDLLIVVKRCLAYRSTTT